MSLSLSTSLLLLPLFLLFVSCTTVNIYMRGELLSTTDPIVLGHPVKYTPKTLPSPLTLFVTAKNQVFVYDPTPRTLKDAHQAMAAFGLSFADLHPEDVESFKHAVPGAARINSWPKITDPGTDLVFSAGLVSVVHSPSVELGSICEVPLCATLQLSKTSGHPFTVCSNP